MSDDFFSTAGQLDRSLKNIEPFCLAVVHVQWSAGSRRVRYLNNAERPVSRVGSGDDADFASRPPRERLPLTGSHDDGSGTDRCLQLGHGHDELLPLLFLKVTSWVAEQNYKDPGSSSQSSE